MSYHFSLPYQGSLPSRVTDFCDLLHQIARLASCSCTMVFLSNEAKKKCELFDDLGWFLQTLLAVAALMILVVKWRLERGVRRPVFIFALDFSKQVIYSLVIHGLNLIIAVTLGEYARKDGACIWYGLVQILGVSAGLAITIVLLSIGTTLKVEGIHDSGYYGEDTKNPRMSMYCMQLWVWVAIVSAQRLLLWGIMHIFRNPLGTFGNWMFGPIKKDADGMAAIVLVVIPILTSIIEYWIQDDILMGVTGAGGKSPVKYKPLKQADDDDDVEKSLNMRDGVADSKSL